MVEDTRTRPLSNSNVCTSAGVEKEEAEGVVGVTFVAILEVELEGLIAVELEEKIEVEVGVMVEVELEEEVAVEAFNAVPLRVAHTLWVCRREGVSRRATKASKRSTTELPQ